MECMVCSCWLETACLVASMQSSCQQACAAHPVHHTTGHKCENPQACIQVLTTMSTASSDIWKLPCTCWLRTLYISQTCCTAVFWSQPSSSKHAASCSNLGCLRTHVQSCQRDRPFDDLCSCRSYSCRASLSNASATEQFHSCETQRGRTACLACTTAEQVQTGDANLLWTLQAFQQT